jgi:thioredoxin-related protein
MSIRTVSVVVVAALLLLGLIAFLTSSDEPVQGANAAKDITWHGFDEGVALAKEQNKKVLVDVYTDWCVWCKKMDKEVYPDRGVGQSINQNFIAVKLNAESQNQVSFDGTKMSEASLAQAMGVTGYPTVLFLDPSAKPITKISGYMQPKEFATTLNFIGEDHYKNQSYSDYKTSIANK